MSVNICCAIHGPRVDVHAQGCALSLSLFVMSSHPPIDRHSILGRVSLISLLTISLLPRAVWWWSAELTERREEAHQNNRKMRERQRTNLTAVVPLLLLLCFATCATLIIVNHSDEGSFFFLLHRHRCSRVLFFFFEARTINAIKRSFFFRVAGAVFYGYSNIRAPLPYRCCI